MEEHGENFPEPPPDLINDKPEYEVEKVLASRRYGQWKKLQYLLQWKGYSQAHDSQEPADNVNAPELVKEFHERNPMMIRTMVLKKGEQTKEETAINSPFRLNTPLSDDTTFPSLLAVIDGMDPTLQGPQPWYDETSPYTARHYSKPEPLPGVTLNELAMTDKGMSYIRPASNARTSTSSIPTVSPTSARSEDKSTNADNASAGHAVEEAGSPIAHASAQPDNAMTSPLLQCHQGPVSQPLQPLVGQRTTPSNPSSCGSTPLPDYPADGQPRVHRQRQNHCRGAHHRNQGAEEAGQ
jgi:Chromo (CHRromatin Organisation MOdifier) domain